MIEVTMYATCTTVGCGNELQAIPVTAEVAYPIFCGPCGTPVTNITNIKPEEGTVLPEWISQMLQTQNSGN